MSHVDHGRWWDAYFSELRRLARDTGGRVLNAIFFGGGTPSLMAPHVVEDIIKEASNLWTFANNIEITLEANPTSSEADRFKGFKSAGVNRLSLGVQALNDADLKALGRLHSADEARTAVDLAMGVFDRVSFDLIYARQHQTLEEWESELKEAIGWGSRHLSLYQLTIENGTAFGDRFSRGTLLGLPQENLAADMYFATQSICEAAGLPAYETSNHAVVGEESIHNQIYWHSGDYLGIGPGAHGRLTLNKTRFATESHTAPLKWLVAVENDKNGQSATEPLTQEDQLSEYLLMGLRTRGGVDMTRVEFSKKLLNNINDLIEIEMLQINDGYLKSTPKGHPLLNAILKQLLDF